ncbi:MAG TPA: DNA polymerase I [Candidatus Saccharimonadales bacterium]|nr:DNA polymerase I [Candidatus Saccharimonadales bacterium]
MAEQARKKLAVIDGKSVFYRGYYAMPNLTTRDGVPTGGVFGFASMALEVIKRLRPDYVAVAWDKPKTNIRRRLELYPEYKAGRKPAPPDFYEQIPVLHELLQAFGWPLYELDDYEADDILGTLAVQASDQGIETMLVTSDLDMLQLVNDHVKVYALKTGFSNIELYSPATFEAKYGISVHQFVDYKSLVGDSSDNIPGVAGVGPVAARKLLGEYKTLDGIYQNIDLISGKTQKQLIEHKDMAYLSHKLAEIWTDAPLRLNLKEVDGSLCQPEKLLALLEKLEFKSLARQLPDVMQVAVADHQAATGAVSLHPGKSIIIDSDEKLADVKLPDSEYMYIHSRAAGKHGRDPQALILSTDGKTTYTFDLSKINTDKLVENFRDVRPLVGYDIKSTLQVLLHLGVKELPPVGHDVLIGSFLINSLRREQTLTELAHADLGYEGSPFEELDADELITRAPEFIAVIHALHQQQAKELADMPKLPALAKNIEWPVIPVLARMEYQGIQLNVDYLKEFSGEIEDSITLLEHEIYGHAGREFNIGSPAQLGEILFETLGLSTTGVKKGKTGYSTAADTLDKLRQEHPIINLITRYREVTKLKNTYVDTLPQQVDGHNRLHTTFALTVAQTGRLSSNDPNLQNIPVRTSLGKRIRTAFVAGKGRKLVSADYSQFELRLAAAMSGDDDMVAQFNRGADIHVTTAAQIYGRQIEDVTKQQRSAAKTVNFGVLYGMSPHGLSAATGMSFEQARHFIDEYFKLRKPLIGYLDGLKQMAREQGYVETLFGRRRPMPDIKSSNFMVRSGAERAAMNMPIQGTEADLMKMAMVAVDNELAKQVPTARQLLQIHDSILVECDQTDAETVANILKKTMESIYPELSVKLLVDASIGDNWGEL